MGDILPFNPMPVNREFCLPDSPFYEKYHYFIWVARTASWSSGNKRTGRDDALLGKVRRPLHPIPRLNPWSA